MGQLVFIASYEQFYKDLFLLYCSFIQSSIAIIFSKFNMVKGILNVTKRELEFVQRENNNYCIF